LPAFADTGHWRVALSVAEKPLGAYDVQVEEFVPERMKVTAAPKQPDLLTTAKVAIDVTALYLFGGSAADSGVEVTCSADRRGLLRSRTPTSRTASRRRARR